jgi:hypothetical protein
LLPETVEGTAGLGASIGIANLGSVNFGAAAMPAPRLLRARSFNRLTGRAIHLFMSFMSY